MEDAGTKELCGATPEGLNDDFRCEKEKGHVERGDKRHSCITEEGLSQWIDAPSELIIPLPDNS